MKAAASIDADGLLLCATSNGLASRPPRYRIEANARVTREPIARRRRLVFVASASAAGIEEAVLSTPQRSARSA
jgi:hypothetical protein